MNGEPARLQEARSRRRGRGRLSSIEMLPEEAGPDVAWAAEQLRESKVPQTQILTEFNERLTARGLPPISKGAFSRYSVRKAVQFGKLSEVRRISGDLVSQMGTGGADEVTMMVAEMIKTSAFQLLESGMSDTKGLMEISRAVSGATAAQKASAEHRRKLEDEAGARAVAAIDAAIKAEGANLGADPAGARDRTAVLRRIREDVYGIFDRSGEEQ